VPSVPPRGSIKIAILEASKFLLLDDGKSSNTKCTVELAGKDQTTPKVKGATP
jgi:hypothetical protein